MLVAFWHAGNVKYLLPLLIGVSTAKYVMFPPVIGSHLEYMLFCLL